jgi:hypothetical protein
MSALACREIKDPKEREEIAASFCDYAAKLEADKRKQAELARSVRSIEQSDTRIIACFREEPCPAYAYLVYSERVRDYIQIESVFFRKPLTEDEVVGMLMAMFLFIEGLATRIRGMDLSPFLKDSDSEEVKCWIKRAISDTFARIPYPKTTGSSEAYRERITSPSDLGMAQSAWESHCRRKGEPPSTETVFRDYDDPDTEFFVTRYKDNPRPVALCIRRNGVCIPDVFFERVLRLHPMFLDR